MTARSLVLTALAVAAAFTSAGAEPNTNAPIPFGAIDLKEPVVFDKHVFAIFSAKCVTCHDRKGGLAEGGLDLTTAAETLKGGKRGPSAAPGKGAESLLVKLAAKQEKPFMPPKGEDPLTPQELSILKLWVDQGAKPGTNLTPAESMKKEVVLGDLPPGIHPVYALDMDKSGSMVAIGRANQLFVHDANTGALLARLGGHRDLISSVRISPDGASVATGGYERIIVWPLPRANVTKALPPHPTPITAAAVSPGGGLAVTASEDKILRLVNLQSAAILRDLDAAPAPVNSLAISPSGALLAVGAADKTARIVRLVDGANLATFQGHADAVTSIAFNETSDRLVSGSRDGTARIWSLALSQPSAPKDRFPASAAQSIVLAGHDKPVTCVALGGGVVVTGSENGAARVYKLADGAPVREVKLGSPPRAIVIHPNGGLVASAGDDGQIRLWQHADGAIIRALLGDNKPVRALSFSRDGSRLVSGSADGAIRVWDLNAGRSLHTIAAHSGEVTGLTFVAGTKSFLSVSKDKAGKVWETVDSVGEPIELGLMTERVTALAWRPDGKVLAAGAGAPASAGEVVLWDVSTKKSSLAFKEPHSDLVTGLAFSPDGKLLASSSADKFIKVHDTASGARTKAFEGHTGQVLCVGWSGDGKTLVSGSADNTVKFWSMETGEQTRTVGGHGKQVTGVTWIGATPMVVSSCGDGVARLINSADGAIPRAFQGAKDFLYSVAASADGKRVVAGGHDGRVLLWDGEAKLLREFEFAEKPALQASR